jgi:single-stranded-DNA-specific exonuclease
MSRPADAVRPPRSGRCDDRQRPSAEFAARFNAVAASNSPKTIIPELRVDMELPLDQADDEPRRSFGTWSRVASAIRRRCSSRGVTVAASPRVVGDGLRLLLKSNGRQLTALGWGMGPRAAEVQAGATIDVAFRLERDEWNGQSRLQARLADFRG